MQKIIVIMAMVTAFCLVAGFFAFVFRNKLAVEKRLENLDKSEKNEQSRRGRKKQKAAGKSLITRKELEKLDDELYDAGLGVRAQEFLIIWGSVTLALPLLLLFFGVSYIIAGAIAIAGAFSPLVIIKVIKKKRATKLEGQLLDAINVLCNSLRAGHSFQSALNSIAGEMEEPIASEFGRVFRETQKGMSLEDSLNRLVDRTKSDDLDMLCSAVIIQRQVGGNLAAVLDNISNTIRERLTLKGEIKAKTASGSMSGYVIGGLPVVIMIAIKFLNPGYMDMFFTTTIGYILLGVCVGMETIGFILIKKTVTIKM